MLVLQKADDLTVNRLEIVKAISMFVAIAKSMRDLPTFTQMESLLPLLLEVWPALKKVMLARQNDSEIVNECSTYLKVSIVSLGLGDWINPDFFSDIA